MAQLNTATKKIIQRLENINYSNPTFDEAKVKQHMAKHYELLGVEMPPVEYCSTLEKGFSAARDAARDAAWDAALAAALDAALDAARDAARDAAWATALAAARDAARDAALAAARDAALDTTWNAQAAAWDAQAAAWATAQATAATNTGLKDPATKKYIAIENEILEALEAGLGWFLPMKDKLILVPSPRMTFDLNNLPHNEKEMVISWGQEGYYFLHGVQFDKPTWKKIVSQKFTIKDLTKITNADQRAIAIKMLSPERLLKHVKAKLIHTGIKGTKLYQVDNFLDTGETEYCMLMTDASTPRQFIEWVEPKVGKLGDADLCQANAWHISKKQYLSIRIEA